MALRIVLEAVPAGSDQSKHQPANETKSMMCPQKQHILFCCSMYASILRCKHTVLQGLQCKHTVLPAYCAASILCTVVQKFRSVCLVSRRGGNSGSPIWVVWPSKQQQQQQGSKPDTSPPDWNRFQAVGVHSSSLKFLKDSQVGVYAGELYAQAIARAQQRQAAAAAGQQSAVCSAVTSSFGSIASTSAATTSAADTSTISQSKSMVAQVSVIPGSTAGPVAATPPVLTRVGAPTKGPGLTVSQGGSGLSSTVNEAAAAVSSVSGRRALLAGAGGREGDGDHILLPVAVPFTGDTYKWIDQVLREFDKCPGE
jgi:hypothetical protein